MSFEFFGLNKKAPPEEKVEEEVKSTPSIEEMEQHAAKVASEPATYEVKEEPLPGYIEPDLEAANDVLAEAEKKAEAAKTEEALPDEYDNYVEPDAEPVKKESTDGWNNAEALTKQDRRAIEQEENRYDKDAA